MCEQCSVSFSDLLRISEQINSLGLMLRSWNGVAEFDAPPEIPGIGLILEDYAKKLSDIFNKWEGSIQEQRK